MKCDQIGFIFQHRPSCGHKHLQSVWPFGRLSVKIFLDDDIQMGLNKVNREFDQPFQILRHTPIETKNVCTELF